MQSPETFEPQMWVSFADPLRETTENCDSVEIHTVQDAQGIAKQMDDHQLRQFKKRNIFGKLMP